MLGWLYSILIGNFCKHEWEIQKYSTIGDHGNDKYEEDFYILRCKKCGNMKEERF